MAPNRERRAMPKPVTPSEFCIDVIQTSRFEAATKRLGVPPSEVRQIVQFVVEQADKGALFLSANGVSLRTIAWENKLTLLYGLNIESAEIYLIDLVEDREPPSPPKKPNILKSLAKKLAPTIAVAAGKKLIDWLIDHYASDRQEQHLHDALSRDLLLKRDFIEFAHSNSSPEGDNLNLTLIHIHKARATTPSKASANSLAGTQYVMHFGRRLTRALGSSQRLLGNQEGPVAK